MVKQRQARQQALVQPHGMLVQQRSGLHAPDMPYSRDTSKRLCTLLKPTTIIHPINETLELPATTPPQKPHLAVPLHFTA